MAVWIVSNNIFTRYARGMEGMASLSERLELAGLESDDRVGEFPGYNWFIHVWTFPYFLTLKSRFDFFLLSFFFFFLSPLFAPILPLVRGVYLGRTGLEQKIGPGILSLDQPTRYWWKEIKVYERKQTFLTDLFIQYVLAWRNTKIVNLPGPTGRGMGISPWL